MKYVSEHLFKSRSLVYLEIVLNSGRRTPRNPIVVCKPEKCKYLEGYALAKLNTMSAASASAQVKSLNV